jgi:uncharacterized membrane protein
MKPDKLAYLYVLIVFIFLGVSVFLDKLATNRLGNRSAIPVIVAYLVSSLVFLIFLVLSKSINYDHRGMTLLLISSLLTAVSTTAYYLLFARSEISWAVPVLSLRAIVPIILGITILHETLSVTKVAGIFLSLLAVILLSL